MTLALPIGLDRLRALAVVLPVEPQQPPPPHAVALTQRFEHGPVVRLGRSPFAGHHPAHLPGKAA